jgi:hypothetical protein
MTNESDSKLMTELAFFATASMFSMGVSEKNTTLILWFLYSCAFAVKAKEAMVIKNRFFMLIELKSEYA